MDFLIITYIPTKQGWMGPIKEQTTIDEATADSVETLKDGLHVPLDGYCLIVEKENVFKVESHIVNELV